jgi:carboxyl-terminal processing protease
MRFAILTLVIVLQFSGRVLGLPDVASASSIFGQKYTNVAPLVPGPYDRDIVQLVGQILQRSHYRNHPLDDEFSSQFFGRYLDALDPQHLYFLQSDLEEFERYRTWLDNLILEEGETLPARVIFRRFRQRIDQQYDLVRSTLESERLEFNTNERYLLNRKDQPRPKDLEEARGLWRDRLRYEYLQEKLNVGRPEEIAGIVREKLDQGKAGEIQGALQDKLSKQKAAEVQKFVEDKAGQEKPEAVAKAVLDKLGRDNEAEILKIIARRYNRILRAINEYDNDDVLQIYLTALARIYDPHSDYMGKAALENFSIGMKLSLFGIGALLQSEDGYCKIVSLTPNGPAERSKKVQPNDRIIAVAQGDEEPVDVVDMKLTKVVDLIRGPKGTQVQLTIIPADAPDPSVRKVVPLVRDKIELEDQEAKAKLFEIPVENSGTIRLGLIDLPSFYSSFELSGKSAGTDGKSTTADVARLIKKLEEEQVAGIILDLRRNGGGSLEEAINLTGLFIKEGPVVQVKDPSGAKPEVSKDSDPSILYEGPLVVLTSRFSASASEIVAGALQDYGRAVIVGDNATHGKGTVQSLIQLRQWLRKHLPKDVDPGALKFTIRKFYRASGASTQLKGVQPDIILPSLNNYAEVGEASLENALEWDTIEPAEFEKLNWVGTFLPELSQRSDQRVSASTDFAFLRQEIKRYQEKMEDKTVSMNEAQRLKEKREADERRKARQKELEARPDPPGQAYEITLRDVDTLGLPEAKKTGSKAEKGSASLQKDGADEADEEEKKPALDVALEETKRILIDLIELRAKKPPITAASATSTNSSSRP